MTPGVRDEGTGEEKERGGAGDGNAKPEERTSERGRELVRAGAFPPREFPCEGWMKTERME